MKTDKGYVAVPWQTRLPGVVVPQVAFDDAGAKVPTTWDELMTAGRGAGEEGLLRVRHGAGAGNNLGAHRRWSS